MYLSDVKYLSCGCPVTNTCNTCNNCTACNTCNCTSNCNCQQATCPTCSLTTSTAILPTECNPVPCLTGCDESISSDCVILTTYCYLNNCQCNGTPINLTYFLTQLCGELQRIDIDIACLKSQLPACNAPTNCGVPLITNVITNFKILWNTGVNSTGQVLAYRLTGTNVWSYSNSLLPQVNSFDFSTNNILLQNALYDLKIVSACTTAQESPIIQYFNLSTISWSFMAISGTSIKAMWNFPNITNVTKINISVYQGTTLIQTHISMPSSIGQYIFMGLTSSTGYTIVYGLEFNAQTFSEVLYPASSLEYLTPAQSLTKYNKKINLYTY